MRGCLHRAALGDRGALAAAQALAGEIESLSALVADTVPVA